MIRRKPSFSIVIPVRPGKLDASAIRALSYLDYPQDKIEILLAEGECPSTQRNEAARLASGEIIYFLDDDSIADEDSLNFAARSLVNLNVSLVGGPSEIIPSERLLQRSIGYVLSSFFATANIRCRYKAIGRRDQPGTEQNLILCNLAVRKKVFDETGGLDERLYPNEENEFINRLITNGYRAVYNPKMVVAKPHRRSLGEFFKQMISYGRGRMRHFILQPKFFNPIYLLPVAFLMYMIGLPLMLIASGPSLATMLFVVPSIIYLEGIAVTTIRILAEERDWPSGLIVPFLFPLVHVGYAIGLALGLFERILPIKSSGRFAPSSSDVRPRVWLVKPLGASEAILDPAPIEEKVALRDLVELPTTLTVNIG